MSEHEWFAEHMAVYGAGGLTAAERQRFAAHQKTCEACAAMLNEFTGFEQSLEEMFLDAQRGRGWEDRVLNRLRTASPRFTVQKLRIRSATRVLVYVAAVLALITIGEVVQKLVVE